jgi:hypothetical protein
LVENYRRGGGYDRHLVACVYNDGDEIETLATVYRNEL